MLLPGAAPPVGLLSRLAFSQQEFQAQESEAVSLLKQGPEITDVTSHTLLDEAPRVAHNGGVETVPLGPEGWVRG